jgi:hypothetical protein
MEKQPQQICQGSMLYYKIQKGQQGEHQTPALEELTDLLKKTIFFKEQINHYSKIINNNCIYVTVTMVRAFNASLCPTITVIKIIQSNSPGKKNITRLSLMSYD